MTHLRKMMLEELERRNYSASTTHCYIRTVEDFALFFQRPPDQLGLEEIRNYQAHLFRDRKLAGNTVSQRLAALRFFYLKTLRKSWNLSLMPYPKKARRLPSVLSQQEVAGLIEAADSVFHRMILMTLYATGVRRAELIRLPAQRHQQQAHGRSCSRRQGPQRPRRHAQPTVARLPKNLPSRAASQTETVVVPRRRLAHWR